MRGVAGSFQDDIKDPRLGSVFHSQLQTAVQGHTPSSSNWSSHFFLAMELMKRQSSFHSVSSPTVGRSYAFSVSGGAGGHGTRISTAGFGSGGYDYHAVAASSGAMAIGNEKATMQHLNDRLANYLETVRNLEKANSTLEIKIREAIEKRGPLEGRDYSRFFAIIEDLRGKVSQLRQYLIFKLNA